MDFIEAVGKLRAYRKIWARLMRDRYGAKREESLRLNLTASPGTMSMTLQQPLNNIARIGIQLLACALGGGAQTMTSPLHDEAHALPSEEAIRVGAAVQNIVAHETGAADTIDPLAGSYYVEHMTRRIEDAVFEEIERVDEVGGALAAIQRGYFQRALADEQCSRNQELENGTRKLIGVNHLQLSNEARDIELFQLADEVEKRQIERVQRVRKERDAGRTARALDDVRTAASTDDNLMPSMLEAVRAHATHGEICDAMRDVFGEHHPDSLTTGI
jgi:methylmalonyl-CoA mutase N-terminal domain/subunit